jgi:hypothetical protein
MAIAAAAHLPRRTDRAFHTGMAIAGVVLVFVGFAPTFYLRGHLPLPPQQAVLSPLLLAHGLIATAWIALFVTQTSLIAMQRVALHRSLGVVGAFVAAAMFIVSELTAVDALRRGVGPFGIDPRTWASFTMTGAVSFAALVTAAVLLRTRPQAHKRLMLLATIGLLNPAIGRLTGPFATDFSSFIVLISAPTDAFIVLVVLYDLWTRRSVHPATIWGGVTILLLPFVLLIGGTPIWLAFADKLY